MCPRAGILASSFSFLSSFSPMLDATLQLPWLFLMENKSSRVANVYYLVARYHHTTHMMIVFQHYFLLPTLTSLPLDTTGLSPDVSMSECTRSFAFSSLDSSPYGSRCVPRPKTVEPERKWIRPVLSLFVIRSSVVWSCAFLIYITC